MNFLVGAIFIMFVLFITVKGELSTYLGLLLYTPPAPDQPTPAQGSAGTGSQGNPLTNPETGQTSTGSGLSSFFNAPYSLPGVPATTIVPPSTSGQQTQVPPAFGGIFNNSQWLGH